MTILDIVGLRISFGESSRPAVAGINLKVGPGERVGIIGESGSGKSVTAMSVLRLNNERIMRYGENSKVLYRGDDLLSANEKTLRGIRGSEISMVFQDPMSVLNPVFKVGAQVLDVLRTHGAQSKTEAKAQVISSFGEVGIHDPERVFGQYPHELSGGMRQRVMIAMAIATGPNLLIADEATSALDVTVQAAVLNTLDRLAESREMSVLMITHDMGVVARFCDRVYVMRGGEVVESGDVEKVLTSPSHEYTRSLLAAVPRLPRD
ncbi:ABC transporter ATP-binding protein [Leucobacter sp. CSA1]|uniref:ABC transporter ATP-binding protein n=1 Tax=Leucobacter chromiisoli TaxID=2796471 RepID=A0A934Q9T6_9MICO|nr:ABC transporter ATP-binding protein [Leucobacter chromiisoli]MBK0420428.1 ABC transporter ATP-binding protein [Leucobacter chromiisoli]